MNKIINISLLAPFFFGLALICYFVFGTSWEARTLQVYWVTCLFSLIVSLLFIVSYFLPKQIRFAYRVGYSSLFEFLYIYQILMYLGVKEIEKVTFWTIWGTVSILIIIFSIYLLSKKNPINTCKN
jgi:hypothetical protein